jgi:hypothetical protein
MQGTTRRLMSGLGLGGLLAMLGAVPALAAPASAAVTTQTCSGTAKAPGVLTGTHPGNVLVKGVCEVNAGPAVVKGNVTIAPGGALLAIFALNDKTHKGFSSLTVKHNVKVGKGAALALGCEPSFFTCADDTGKTPTLQSRGTIGGSLSAAKPLGVLVHNSSITGSVTEQGGGGGLSCTPTGIFKLFKSPVYSDYEDDVIGGSVRVTGLRSCWTGLLRDDVHGSFTYSDNKMADPDANEVVHNYVNKALTCLANVPAIQYGDSGSTPNVVNRTATGQCSFSSLKPNPAPKGPLMPISVPATG